MSTTSTAPARTSDRARLNGAQAAAWRTFLEAHAAIIEVLERELRIEEELPLTWYDVLVQLSEADDHQLRMQELAEAVLLSKSGLTRLVDRMEKAGLVCREACETDRRGTYARMTAEGRSILERTAPTHARGVREHFIDQLSDEEVDVLAAALGRVVERLR